MPAAPASTVGVAPRAASGSSVNVQAGAELLPATDTLWHDVYHVIAPISGEGEHPLWKAHRTDSAEEVVLRVMPGTVKDARTDAWSRLCTIELSHLQRAREGIFAGGCRVEVTDPIRGTPLNVWRRERPSVDVATIEAVVGQLSEALGVLHASGLAHLGVRPEVIFVREEKGALHFTLSGLETVTRFEGDAPIVATADPFYAPPEAAALQQHEPAPILCAWDWWSLGRVAQELILGCHVVDKLPDADPTHSAPMRAARAEALLLEHAAKGMRAGAVEVMVGLEPRLDLLLRGLLASEPEGRWGIEFVDRWLRQKTVKERYTVPRIERKFRWRGRLFTVVEAAKELRKAEFWDEAATHVFEPNTPETLAHFIQRSTDQELVRQQLSDLLKLGEVAPLSLQPPAVARQVLLTLVLLHLAGANLIWRGRRLDGECLHAILAEDADNPERLAFVRVLTNRTITAQIDRCDFEAGRSLTEIGRFAAEAESIIRRHGWLKGTDEAALLRVFRVALEPEAALLAARERLRQVFACASQPTMDKIFKSAKPARAELVALAWAEPTAATCGFVTHADWEKKQFQDLRDRGGQLVGALFWARLGRALAAGPGIFGGWLAFAACWILAAIVIAALWPGPKTIAFALVPAVLAMVARIIGSLTVSGVARRFVPDARPWKWSDGAPRCRAEMLAVSQGRDATTLENSLGEINAGIAKLTLLNPPPASLAGPPLFGGLRMVALASWVLFAGVIAVGGWRAKSHRPSWSAFQTAWFPAAAKSPATPIVAGADGSTASGPAAKPAVGATAGTSTSDAPSGPVKVSWPYKAGDEAQVIGVKETLAATGAQESFALKRGRQIAAPYRPETINTLVIFDVPVGEKIAVMVFDSAKDAVVSPRVYFLEYRPMARSWIDVGGHKGIYISD